MAKTVVSPSMRKVASLDSFAKRTTQSACPPAQVVRMKNSPETFKSQPDPQTFRFKKNARGKNGESE